MNGKDIKFIELLYYELPEAFAFVQHDLIDASLNMLDKQNSRLFFEIILIVITSVISQISFHFFFEKKIYKTFSVIQQYLRFIPPQIIIDNMHIQNYIKKKTDKRTIQMM